MRNWNAGNKTVCILGEQVYGIVLEVGDGTYVCQLLNVYELAGEYELGISNYWNGWGD
jgi:hypothetical protein